jgi:hypothetical protein
MAILTEYVKSLYVENILKIVHLAIRVKCILYRVVWRGIYCGTVREKNREKVRERQNIQPLR